MNIGCALRHLTPIKVVYLHQQGLSNSLARQSAAALNITQGPIIPNFAKGTLKLLSKLTSLPGFLGANVALAISLTVAHLLGLILHCPDALLWIIGMVVFLVAWEKCTPAFGADSVVALFEDAAPGFDLVATVITVLLVAFAWVLLRLLAGMHGVRLDYVILVFGLYVYGFCLRARVLL